MTSAERKYARWRAGYRVGMRCSRWWCTWVGNGRGFVGGLAYGLDGWGRAQALPPYEPPPGEVRMRCPDCAVLGRLTFMRPVVCGQQSETGPWRAWHCTGTGHGLNCGRLMNRKTASAVDARHDV